MHYLAVDLGAESGRVMIGTIQNDKLTLGRLTVFPMAPSKKTAP
jgi:hypothetical protein